METSTDENLFSTMCILVILFFEVFCTKSVDSIISLLFLSETFSPFSLLFVFYILSFTPALSISLNDFIHFTGDIRPTLHYIVNTVFNNPVFLFLFLLNFFTLSITDHFIS